MRIASNRSGRAVAWDATIVALMSFTASRTRSAGTARRMDSWVPARLNSELTTTALPSATGCACSSPCAMVSGSKLTP